MTVDEQLMRYIANWKNLTRYQQRQLYNLVMELRLASQGQVPLK